MEFLLTIDDGSHFRVEADSREAAKEFAESEGYTVEMIEPWLTIRHLRTQGLDVGRDALRES
jgi:hypothetical protein